MPYQHQNFVLIIRIVTCVQEQNRLLREIEETRTKMSDKQLAESIEEVGLDIEEQLNQHLLVSATTKANVFAHVHSSVIPRNKLICVDTVGAKKVSSSVWVFTR